MGKRYCSACNAGVTEDKGLIPGQEDPLEEDMATHSSILAWRIPQTEEPGGLWAMQLQKSWTRLKQFSTCALQNTGFPVLQYLLEFAILIS